MPKMRFGWYAGASTALAASTFVSAFYQRPNFYSAMVYLAQSNTCLLILANFILLVYSAFVYGLTRLCFGSLRVVEGEQLTERAWFAITETCLAMTIFREEIGAWFLVMFTSLVTGKIWGWIGDGRVEVLEQQPPANPRLFHTRLSISLTISILYDLWLFHYTSRTVIRQARPTMMVMFLFEFAVLTTNSLRTGVRYLLSLAEIHIVQTQTEKRLRERRLEVSRQRDEIMRQRAQATAAGEPVPDSEEPLPDPEDIDEMDIEVPGWASKGEWVLWLDLSADLLKLCIYLAFFSMILTFYGFPIHIMRDLFITGRDFIRRLNALLRYRKAIQEMNQYPDPTEEELARENTCIICREEMRPWAQNPGAVDRVRPKKLPCGHSLHLGCLKSWLERQQVCPTCRSPVTLDRARVAPAHNPPRVRAADPARPGQPPVPDVGLIDDAPAPRMVDGANNRAPVARGLDAGILRFRGLANQLGVPRVEADGAVPPVAGLPPNAAAMPRTPIQARLSADDNLQEAGHLLRQAEHLLWRELQDLQTAQNEIQLRQQELQASTLLMAELLRLRAGDGSGPGLGTSDTPATGFVGSESTAAGRTPNSTGLPSLGVARPPSFRSSSGGDFVQHFQPARIDAIQAGSSELPEGFVLPPGWSLVPFESQTGQFRPGAQMVPTTEATPTAAQPSQLQELNEAARSGAQASPSNPAGGNNNNTSNEVTTSTEAPNAESEAPLPGADASEPIMHPGSDSTTEATVPAWGGSAQMFSSARDPVENSTPLRPSSSQHGTPMPRMESSEGSGSSPSDEVQDKGKGRAVTVEEED